MTGVTSCIEKLVGAEQITRKIANEAALRPSSAARPSIPTRAGPQVRTRLLRR